MGIGSSGVVNCANTYLGTANYTVADGDIADRTPIVGGNGPAQLNLNFTRNEVLDPRVTFSRTSNATRVNAQGLIEYAPHNLLTYSEQFDNAIWTKNTATVSANYITAPDGATTADLITSTGADGYFGRGQSGISGNQQYTASIYLRSDTPTTVRLYLLETVGGSNSNYTVCNITDQWQRFSVSITTGSTVTSISTQIGGASTFGTSKAIYAWGYQLNIGSLQPYYTTSVKNLLGYSQNFENAAWAKSNSTIDATPVMGPLGFLGAEKLVENTAAVVPHGLAVDTSSLSSTTQYTFSVYAKAAERTWIRLGLVDNLGTDGGRAWFDLSNGVVGTVETNGAGSNINATINSIGGGWYRCRLTIQMNNGKTTLQSQVRLATANNVLSYTGDGTSGIYIFGAQLSDSASLDTYSYNFGAAPTSTAYYGPRFDYDPVTLAPKGLLIEEARTNLLTYSSEFDNNAVWTRGVGLTVTPNTAISPDGSQNADTITANGSAATASIYYDNITVTASTSYTFSIYVKLGTLAASDYKIAVYNVTGSAFIAIDATPTQVPNSTGWTRISYTFTTPVGCISARVYPYRSSATVNATMYLYGAQLEQGAFPTSYIPTTSAQVTRAADNASMVGTNFSSWYNQSEGTVATEVNTQLTTGYIASIMRATGYGPRIQCSIAGVLNTTGAYVVDDSGSVVVALSRNGLKSAFAYKSDNYALSAAGLSAVTDNSGIVPSGIIQLKFCRSPVDDTYLNGHIKTFKFFSKRFINTYLQSLTQ